MDSRGFEWPQINLWNVDDLVCVVYGPTSTLNLTMRHMHKKNKCNTETTFNV